jgi:DNA-binding transcriptional LysR family regulator
MDQLDTLRLFIAIAGHGSFAEAARERRVSATAASRAIAELEDRLGAILLRRTTRSVSLTDEGAAYLEHCRHAIAELDDAARTLRGENSTPRGLLVVTAPVVFGRLHVLPTIKVLTSAYPDLNVRLTLTDRVIRLVEEGVDVAVRIADLSDSALHAARLGQTRRVLVASPDYLAQRGTPQAIAHLHQHDLLAFENFAPNGEWRFGSGAKSVARIEPRLLTNSAETVIDAAVVGMGIARALCYQVRHHVEAGRLVHVLTDHDPPPVPVSLLFQANRSRAPNVRAFIDEMRRRSFSN